jgi:shikimate dehydrogenase
LAAKRVGIIGYPIRHSASPAFQNAALKHCGVDAEFTAWEVAPEDLAKWVWGQDRSELLGFGVTVPHKTEIIRQLDHIDEDAASVGAVNTVVITEQRELVGYNTDTYGFLHALQQEGGFNVRGQDVLVLGAGGVSRAVCGVLLREGVASLTLANRTASRAEALLDDLDRRGIPAVSVALEDAAIAKALVGRDPVGLIVNCTSMGMLHGPAEGATPIGAELIPPSAFVYDLVYNPPVTPLMELAQGVGVRTLNGLPMLVYQGARGFHLWTGLDAPVDVMMAAAREAVGG